MDEIKLEIEKIVGTILEDYEDERICKRSNDGRIAIGYLFGGKCPR